MNKYVIQLLAVIMALTFAGLLYVQIMYIRNMAKMRNDQFEEGVRRSLYTVSTTLEQEEARHFLEDDVAMLESSVLPQSPGGPFSFVTPDGVLPLENNILKPQISPGVGSDYSTKQKILKEQYLYHRGLINEVILNLISRSANRPIQQRADSATVAELLANEFASNGLMMPFEFAVINRAGQTAYRTDGFNLSRVDKKDLYVQALFPHDGKGRMNYVEVFFPEKKEYIFQSLRFMIPSFIFTGILLVVFLYTIIVAFKQKKLSEMKNDFINNMTHEFKTPISTISLAAQMLNDNSVRKSPKTLEHISTVITDETKRLRFQVEKVLQMSMFDRQKATLRLQDVDANIAIDNIVHTFKIKVEKYGGSIETNLAADDAIVNVDEMHFTNVIFNLLDNAVKYRREDVPLQLTVATRDIPGNRLEITVADNGIGIRKEDLKKIFEKFYRVSTGNRHDVKGFGLGLAYVHKMIGEFGGQITVESTLGIGTKFIVILPLNKD